MIFVLFFFTGGIITLPQPLAENISYRPDSRAVICGTCMGWFFLYVCCDILSKAKYLQLSYIDLTQFFIGFNVSMWISFFLSFSTYPFRFRIYFRWSNHKWQPFKTSVDLHQNAFTQTISLCGHRHIWQYRHCGVIIIHHKCIMVVSQEYTSYKTNTPVAYHLPFQLIRGSLRSSRAFKRHC